MKALRSLIEIEIKEYFYLRNQDIETETSFILSQNDQLMIITENDQLLIN